MRPPFPVQRETSPGGSRPCFHSGHGLPWSSQLFLILHCTCRSAQLIVCSPSRCRSRLSHRCTRKRVPNRCVLPSKVTVYTPSAGHRFPPVLATLLQDQQAGAWSCSTAVRRDGLLFVAVAPVAAVDTERVRVGFALVVVVAFLSSGSRTSLACGWRVAMGTRALPFS